ncbi:MAG: hypothetical protein NVS4B3_12170 [Gemmatimonadaceae bacterium]
MLGPVPRRETSRRNAPSSISLSRMLAIIMEGVLSIAAAATLGALLYRLTTDSTPFGIRRRQERNRRVIERAAELHCSVHGDHRPEEMVRLPSGEEICPQCFKETVDGFNVQ